MYVCAYAPLDLCVAPGTSGCARSCYRARPWKGLEPAATIGTTSDRYNLLYNNLPFVEYEL